MFNHTNAAVRMLLAGSTPVPAALALSHVAQSPGRDERT